MRINGPPSLNLPSVERKLVEFIRAESGGRGLALGLSGGIDSAVIAALAVRAVGSEHVLALIMPDEAASDPRDMKDAVDYAEKLGIRHEIIDITQIYACLMNSVPGSGDRLAEGNVKARLRMTLLYYFANSEGRIVVGSGDRSELALGYFTKYGDGGTDILPIGGLYKTQVRKMAVHLGVPKRIVMKKSSPSLWAGQWAEDELGLEYKEADLLLHLHLDKGHGRERLIEELGKGWERKVDMVLSRLAAYSHKLKMPPVAEIKD
jgi:NAD+ synthase